MRSTCQKHETRKPCSYCEAERAIEKFENGQAAARQRALLDIARAVRDKDYEGAGYAYDRFRSAGGKLE